jgi:hypothetical protein
MLLGIGPRNPIQEVTVMPYEITRQSKLSFVESGLLKVNGGSPWTPVTVGPYIDTFYMLSKSNGRNAWMGGPGDKGGSFALLKTEFNITPDHLNDSLNQRPVLGVTSASFGPTYNPSMLPDATMRGMGTTAIARSLPTNPSSDFATFSGELMKDGLPSMIGSSLFKERVRLAHSAGDEYLNGVFGWLPIVSDLKKFGLMIKNHNQIIHNYRKGSDQKIRRRYVFDPADDLRSAKVTNVPLGGNAGFGQGDITESAKTRTWFSGAFRYHIPVSDSALGKLAEYESIANKLLGFRLTPEVVWNLTPWSWAADWFGNTGDILHNISALGRDGLAMQYGYMMRSQESNYTVRTTKSYSQTKTIHTSYNKKMKALQRMPASPYGFGVTWDGLSTKQAAVVAALGITRV